MRHRVVQIKFLYLNQITIPKSSARQRQHVFVKISYYDSMGRFVGFIKFIEQKLDHRPGTCAYVKPLSADIVGKQRSDGLKHMLVWQSQLKIFIKFCVA